MQNTLTNYEIVSSVFLCTGEEHFISGEYSECIQIWRDQLWEETARGMQLTTSC